jgi:hypothetical protein
MTRGRHQQLNAHQRNALFRCVDGTGAVPIGDIHPSVRQALVQRGLAVQWDGSCLVTEAGRAVLGRSAITRLPTLEPGTAVRFSIPCGCLMIVDESFEHGRWFRVRFLRSCTSHALEASAGSGAMFMASDLVVHHDQPVVQPPPEFVPIDVQGTCRAPWSTCVRRSSLAVTYGPDARRSTVETCPWCARVARTMWETGGYVGRRVPYRGHQAYRVGGHQLLRIHATIAQRVIVVPVQGTERMPEPVEPADLVVLGPPSPKDRI